jgi:hypothetical protein
LVVLWRPIDSALLVNLMQLTDVPEAATTRSPTVCTRSHLGYLSDVGIGFLSAGGCTVMLSWLRRDFR